MLLKPTITITSDNFMFDFKQIVEEANDVIIITEPFIDAPSPKILYVNSAFEKLTGYEKDEVVGKSPRILQGPDTSELTKRAIKRALINRSHIRTPIQNYTKDKTPYWVELSIIPLFDNGKLKNFAAIQREITSQKIYEAELIELSQRDALTGAYNRRFGDAMLSGWLLEQNTKSENCILLLDIDNFKAVNDIYGHQAGDKFLIETVLTIKDFLRSTDEVCRMGGEEFLVFLPNTHLTDAEHIAERIRKAMMKLLVESDGKLVQTTICIGITRFTNEDTELKSVLERVDRALYSAKNGGKNMVVTIP